MFIIEEELDPKEKEQQQERALKLAVFYKEEGLYEEAIENYNKFILLSGSKEVDYAIYKDIAICYSLTGLTAEAINNLKKALKVNSEDTSVVYLLAQMYKQAGMFEEAEYFYSLVLDKEAENASVYYQLGEISYKKGNVDQALLNWSKVVEIEPTNSYAFYLIGSLSYYKQDYETALEKLVKAKENGFKSLGLYNYIGKTYKKLGNSKKAKENFMIALEKDRTNALVYKLYLTTLDDEEMKLEEEKLHDMLGYTLNKFRLGIFYKFNDKIEESKRIFENLLADNLDESFKSKIRTELEDVFEKK